MFFITGLLLFFKVGRTEVILPESEKNMIELGKNMKDLKEEVIDKDQISDFYLNLQKVYEEPLNVTCEYLLTSSFLQWKYQNCEVVFTNLFFVDRTPYIEKLIDLDTESAISYMNQVYSNQSLCSNIFQYEILYKGDLIFVIQGNFLNQKVFTKLNFSTFETFFCEFNNGKSLKILKGSQGLMIKTQTKDLEYFINESNEASSDKTSLDLALCKQNMKPDIWYQNCIDPGLFVGWYISTVYEENRILQTKNGKNLEKNLGVCYFEEKTFVGFLIFIKNLNFVEVFGASNVWGNVSIIANKEYWLETEKITPDKNRIHGKISENNILGLELQVKLNSTAYSCIVGIKKQLEHIHKEDPEYSLWYSSLIIILSLTISVLIFKKLKNPLET